MSLAASLLAGYSSDEDPIVQEEGEDVESGSESKYSQEPSNLSFQTLTSTSDLSKITDITKYSKMLSSGDKLVVKMKSMQETDPDMIDRELENEFLTAANEFLDDLKDEIVAIHAFIQVHYKAVWPDLDDLIKNPFEFAKVIQITKDNIGLVVDQNHLFSDFLKKDQVLGLTVSASLLKRSNHKHKLQEFHLKLILDSCNLLLKLEDSRQRIKQYVSNRASIIAPNVTAIVGPNITAQLISVHGLDGLCKTPSCNLPSLGVNRSRTAKGNVGTRNRGYLYDSDLAQSVTDDYRVQAMRMISAKVILSARIDYSNKDKDSVDNSNGLRWRQEIANKLEKLQVPPDSKIAKPLPKPITNKSKNRAGRRFRKQKERMEMSDIAKAQNKMTFGEKEDTIMDSFGEEIGMGMIGKLSSRTLTNRETSRPQTTKALATKLKKFGSTIDYSNSSPLAKVLNQDEKLFRFEGQSEAVDSGNKNKRLDWLQVDSLKRRGESQLSREASKRAK